MVDRLMLRADELADPVRAQRGRQHRLPGDRRRPVRPRAREGLLLPPRDRLGERGVRSLPRAPRIVRQADLLRQARDGALRQGRRPSRLRDAHGRRARGHGRGRKRVRCALRLLGRWPARRALRDDLPGADALPRALRDVREALRPRRRLSLGADARAASGRGGRARAHVGREHGPHDHGAERRRRASHLVRATGPRGAQPGGCPRPHPS